MTVIVGISINSSALPLDGFMKFIKAFASPKMMGFSVAAMLCYTAAQTNKTFGKWHSQQLHC